jgi:phage terminase small subunit
MLKGDKLSLKEEGFVNDFIDTKNGSEAIRRNYNVKNDNVAGVMAHENLNKPKIAKKVESIVKKMERERDRLISALAEKDLEKENYKVIVDGLDKLTKNIQLLNDRPTAINKNDMSELTNEELNELIQKRSDSRES